MSEEQQVILTKAIKTNQDCEAVEGMPFSVSQEVIKLLFELKVT